MTSQVAAPPQEPPVPFHVAGNDEENEAWPMGFWMKV